MKEINEISLQNWTEDQKIRVNFNLFFFKNYYIIFFKFI